MKLNYEVKISGEEQILQINAVNIINTVSAIIENITYVIFNFSCSQTHPARDRRTEKLPVLESQGYNLQPEVQHAYRAVLRSLHPALNPGW